MSEVVGVYFAVDAGNVLGFQVVCFFDDSGGGDVCHYLNN